MPRCYGGGGCCCSKNVALTSCCSTLWAKNLANAIRHFYFKGCFRIVVVALVVAICQRCCGPVDFVA